MDRDGLFADVLADLNREDKIERLPGWLAAAEFRINQVLRSPDMIKRATLPITEKEFPTPPDFIAYETLKVRHEVEGEVGTSAGTLVYMPADQIDNGFSRPVSEHPRGPRWFTLRGNRIELGGWNSPGSFQIDLYYFSELEKLPNPNSTNWLLTKAPHIYKNMMLGLGFKHLMEFEAATNATTEAMTEIQVLNDTAENNKYGTGPLIQRPARRIGGRHS